MNTGENMIGNEDFNNLVKKHNALNEEVDELASSRILMPPDQQKLKELKILKLRYRDTIEILRRGDASLRDRGEVEVVEHQGDD